MSVCDKINASNEMSIAGNVLGKLKNLTRSKWHRKLVEVGLEDQCGQLTTDGRETVLRMLAQRAYEADGASDGMSLRQEIGNGLVSRDKEIAEERKES